MRRGFVALILILVLAVGMLALLTAPPVMAKKGGKPKPPPCNCAPTVGPCVLESCGQFDCVYVCPFP